MNRVQTNPTVERPGCAVRGVLEGGRAMCGRVGVGGKSCHYEGKCEHQSGMVEAPAPRDLYHRIPSRQNDPIGYARFWMGDLFPLLQERADKMRLGLQSNDVPKGPTSQGLKRLNHLVDKNLLLRLARKENGAYIFVPVDFLAEYFLTEAAKSAAQTATKDGSKQC